jgi:hypothetical protein
MKNNKNNNHPVIPEMKPNWVAGNRNSGIKDRLNLLRRMHRYIARVTFEKVLPHAALEKCGHLGALIEREKYYTPTYQALDLIIYGTLTAQ